jgi:hypothetical protein
MYAAFPIVIFFIGAAILVGLPVASTLQSYFRSRGRRQVVCPDDRQRAEVEVDPKFALQAAMQGKELSQVQTCSHWPSNGECGQECLAQVEATPENLDRLFAKWFKGKPCAICLRTITPSDWRHGRLGFLNDEFKLVEMRQVDVTELGSIAQPKRPLCWTCHQQEKQRQAAPVRVGFVDRQKLKA